MEQALADEARELRLEEEREARERKKKLVAGRRASIQPASSAPEPFPALETDPAEDAQTATTVGRRGSVSAKSPASSSFPVISRFDPHQSFRRNRAMDDDEDLSFGMTQHVDRTVEPPKPKTPITPNVPVSPKPTTSTGPQRRYPNAMATVYGRAKKKQAMPGDLGPNDPRKKPTISKSQSPSSRIPGPADDASKTIRHPRRASDGALLRQGQKENEGGVRLAKDYEEAVDSSDDEYEGDTDASADGGRGRDRERGSTRIGKAVGAREDSEDSDVKPRRTPGGSSPGLSRRSPLSNDPTITVTPPVSAGGAGGGGGWRSDVHPHVAYDDGGGSAASTPRNSDDEEHLSDLRRAQKLSLTVSPIHSTPSAHRVIRQIVRGDYAHFQREAEAGRRRQRVYLVATDLSPEAEYALEWTIGTVLRDGDTLLALYAVDEEGGTGVTEGVEIGHGADVVKDTASIVGSLPAERLAQSPGLNASGKLPRESSTVRETRSKPEKERFKAAEDISERCVKLLRKTRLQIRVVVEVFHCKSPRHMITEVVSHPPTSCLELCRC